MAVGGDHFLQAIAGGVVFQAAAVGDRQDRDIDGKESSIFVNSGH
jgi:hypothetical protein